MTGFLGGLRTNQASTHLDAEDPRLRGRTYAIPFEDVWQAAVGLAGGGLRGWGLVSADDQKGRVVAIVRPAMLMPEVEVRVRVGLDENAQTRVDALATARSERGDLGRCRRLLGSFFSRLDRRLGARTEQILDPRSLVEYGATQ